MKRGTWLSGVLIAALAAGGCKKTEEKILDCFGESIKTSLQITVSPGNSREITTEVGYWGSKAISSIKWEFGDGTSTTTSARTSSHTYTAAGTYTVTARVSFTEGKSSCTVDPTKPVSIQ